MSLVKLSSDNTPIKFSARSLDVPHWMDVFNERVSACSETALTILVEDLDFIQSSWEIYFKRHRESLKCYLDPESFLKELLEIAKLPGPKRFFLDCDIGTGHDGAGPRIARTVREACPDSQIFLETSYSRSDFSEELASGVLDEVFRKIPELIFEPERGRSDGSKEFLDIHPVRIKPRQAPKPPEKLPEVSGVGVTESTPLQSARSAHWHKRAMNLGLPYLFTFSCLVYALFCIPSQLPLNWRATKLISIGLYRFRIGDLLALIAVGTALFVGRKLFFGKWTLPLNSESAADRMSLESKRIRAMGPDGPSPFQLDKGF